MPTRQTPPSLKRYEEAHDPIPAADAVFVVRFLLERQDLTQRDLVPEFGSESAVSMFLARHGDLRSSKYGNEVHASNFLQTFH